MFETVRNAFKIKEIRDIGSFFTFLMLIVIRIGSQNFRFRV